MGIGTSIVLLIAAVVMAAIAVLWDLTRRNADIGRLRHPANPPPIEIAVIAAEDGEGGGRWQITARAGVPIIALDILTYRSAGSSAEWTSAPIVDPILLEPGNVVVLPWPAPDPAGTFDVVIAWTLRHPSGDVQGSRMVSVGDRPGATPVLVASSVEPEATARWVPVLWGLAAILLIGAAAVANRALVQDRDGGSVATATTPSTPPATTDPATTYVTTTPSSSGATAPPASARPTTIVPVATTLSPTASAPEGTSPSTAPTPTTSPSTPTPTPTTSIAPTTDPPDPSLPRVDIDARIGECRYGDGCLIAGFRIVGFTSPDGEYVCEFADGSRFVFRFDGDGADDACASDGPDASITIEVDGLRSDTVTRADAEP